MKRLLLSLAIFLGLLASSLAQVNVTPQPGLSTGYYAKQTYSSAFFALVPPTGANSDFLCISGSATRIVRIQRITLWGTTATAAQTMPIQMLRRASLDTGGTVATTTANPGIATQIASRDTGQNLNTASTAVLNTYTAAPTIVDTAPVYIDSQLIALPLGLATTQAPGVVDFHFARDAENNVQLATLRGTAQQICLNNSTALGNASVYNGSVVWTEE
jgi:hypothetical protein